MQLFQVAAYGQRINRLINDDWLFRMSYQVHKETKQRVDLPHTWNAQDALSGKADYKRGIGNYYKELFIDSSWRDRRIYLRFDGGNAVADLFVNGKHVGEHRGGDMLLLSSKSLTLFSLELPIRSGYGSTMGNNLTCFLLWVTLIFMVDYIVMFI